MLCRWFKYHPGYCARRPPRRPHPAPTSHHLAFLSTGHAREDGFCPYFQGTGDKVWRYFGLSQPALLPAFIRDVVQDPAKTKCSSLKCWWWQDEETETDEHCVALTSYLGSALSFFLIPRALPAQIVGTQAFLRLRSSLGPLHQEWSRWSFAIGLTFSANPGKVLPCGSSFPGHARPTRFDVSDMCP